MTILNETTLKAMNVDEIKQYYNKMFSIIDTQDRIIYQQKCLIENLKLLPHHFLSVMRMNEYLKNDKEYLCEISSKLNKRYSVTNTNDEEVEENG